MIAGFVAKLQKCLYHNLKKGPFTMDIKKFKKGSVKKIIDEAFRDGRTHKHGTINQKYSDNNFTILDNVPRDEEGATNSKLICNKIKELGVTRKIQDNANLMVTTVINLPMDTQLPNNWQEDEDFKKDCELYFTTMVEAWCKTVGIPYDKVLYAVAHMDETTPHLHIGALPVFEYESKPNKKTGKVKQGYRLSCDFIDKKFLYNFHPEMQKNAQALFNKYGDDIEVKLYDEERIAAKHEAWRNNNHDNDYVPMKRLKQRTAEAKQECEEQEANRKALEDAYKAQEARYNTLMAQMPTEDALEAKKNELEALQTEINSLNDDISSIRTIKAKERQELEEIRKAKQVTKDQQYKDRVKLNAFNETVKPNNNGYSL